MTETSAADQEFAELISFLQDPKPEVQRFAAEGVLAQTESQDFLEYCQKHPRAVAKQLLRLAERAEADAVAAAAKLDTASGEKAARATALAAAQALATGRDALQALVNLSAVPAVRDELVGLGAPRRVAETLQSGWLEGRSDQAHWLAMLLANITTGKLGQEALCANEPMLRFLIAAYVAKARPAPRDGYNDPLIFLGRVVANLCALPAGRQLIAGGEQGPATLTTFLAQLKERERRPDMMGIFRNVCADKEYLPAVIQTDLVACFACFLYPWEKVEGERRSQLPEPLQELLQSEGAALTGEITVRRAAAACFLGLCQTVEGREYLRQAGCYEVMRPWHLEETDEETRLTIEAVVPAVHFSEQELEANQRAEEAEAAAEAAAAEAAAVPKEPPAPLPRVTPGPLPARNPGVQTAPEGEGEFAGLEDLFEGMEEPKPPA